MDIARIDFYRGVDGDDWENLAWVRLLARLPRYRRGLAARQNPASIENCGNAMEMIGGLSYAAFTHFRHLPLTSEVTFPYAARGVLPSQSRELWGPCASHLVSGPSTACFAQRFAHRFRSPALGPS